MLTSSCSSSSIPCTQTRKRIWSMSSSVQVIHRHAFITHVSGTRISHTHTHSRIHVHPLPWLHLPCIVGHRGALHTTTSEIALTCLLYLAEGIRLALLRECL